jgi:membrane protein
VPAHEPSRVVRLAVRGAEEVRTALRVLDSESVRLRAMALTYISLFALVPALVVAFSVVQAFTGASRISALVHDFLFENLAVGARTTVEPYFHRFITNAHVTSAGIVGAALLVWSAVTLFSNVDRAVNDIWGVQRRRGLAQQWVIYWVGLTLGPLLLAGSVTLAASARSFLASTGIRFVAAIAGGLLTCTFFSLLYVLVPYTKVRIRAAVIAGVAAGLAWEVAKWAYALGVGGAVRYHAVYGSVAAVPIFIFWLFVSWSIVLFGARLAFVIQYASALIQGGPQATSQTGREILAGQALLQVARAYDRGDPAPDPGDVGSGVGSSAEEAGEVLAALRNANLVVPLADGGLVPSRPLERITLLDVRRAVAGSSAVVPPSRGPVGQIIKEIELQAEARLAEVNLRELLDRSAGPKGATASDTAPVEEARGLPLQPS